ncbi:MAG: PP2C family protein-serine/threonine phosphatase [Opitutales bacterium]
MLEAVAASSVGLVRTQNQDSWGIYQPNGSGPAKAVRRQPARLPVPAILAVADGMGGARSGDVASRTLIERLPEVLARETTGIDFSDTVAVESGLADALEQLHGVLVALADSSEAYHGMGSTLSLAWLTQPERLWIAHVGDSRIYRWRDGLLEQLTHDHSHVGALVRAGHLSDSEARTHPKRSVLQQAMGASETIDPQVLATDVRVGDRFLLCSDGVTDGLTDRDLKDLLQLEIMGKAPFADCAQLLVDEADRLGGRDNATAVLARILPDTAGGLLNRLRR